MFLEKMEKEGKGDYKICIVSIDCEPIGDCDKFVTNIRPYYDDTDNTVTITD